MDKTENAVDPRVQVRQLEERNRRLQDLLAQSRRREASLLEQAQRWERVAFEERQSWMRTHDALNLLRQDAMRVMEEQNAQSVYHELENEREAHQKLREKRQRWRQFARQSVEMKVLLAQKVRDRDKTIEELRGKLEDARESLEKATDRAQEIINARDEQLTRIAAWAEKWTRGEVATVEVMAAIAGEFNGSPAPDVSVMERRRAVLHAQTESLMCELGDQLEDIGKLLARADIKPAGTRVEQVEELLKQYRQQQDDINEWKSHEGRARGAAVNLAEHFQASGNVVRMLLTGNYDGALQTLKDE